MYFSLPLLSFAFSILFILLMYRVKAGERHFVPCQSKNPRLSSKAHLSHFNHKLPSFLYYLYSGICRHKGSILTNALQEAHNKTI